MKINRDNFRTAMTDLLADAATRGKSYIDSFEIEVEGGLNTASVIEICRSLQNPGSFEQRVRMAKICLAGKNVTVKCPNGDVEKFCLGDVDAGLEGIPLFEKDPAALIAIADAVQGELLKKYLRRPKGQAAPGI